MEIGINVFIFNKKTSRSLPTKNYKQGTRGTKKGPPAVPSFFLKSFLLKLSGRLRELRHRLVDFTVYLPSGISSCSFGDRDSPQVLYRRVFYKMRFTLSNFTFVYSEESFKLF